MKNNFSYSERLGNFENDNKIAYSAGPAEVTICAFQEQITIFFDRGYEFLMNDFLLVATAAWELDKLPEGSIQVHKTTITINFNYNTLKMYIEHTINFS